MAKLNKKVSIGTAVFSAVSLKLCCWGPFVLIGVAGVSGGSTYFSWLDTIKPYLLILAFLSLAYGFYQVYKPKNMEVCDNCTSKNKSIYRSKIYIWLVATFVVLMTLVSYYPQLFYRPLEKNRISMQHAQVEIVKLSIKGITCSSCEENINHTVAKLDGVINVKTSKKNAAAVIKFDQTKINVQTIKNAIASKGYILNTIEYE